MEEDLPQPCADLPNAADLVRGNLRVSGSFFLECFAGNLALTISCIFAAVPCIKPWDTRYGQAFNVLTQGSIILALIQAARISCAQFATPCRSMTWARCPQLRSAFFPEGLPFLDGKQLDLVSLGNALLAFTTSCCYELWDRGGYFCIENPELSWLWLQGSTVFLASLAGICFTRFAFSDFAVPFFKPTLLLHNIPTLHRLREAKYPWPGECIRLRGKIWWEGKLQFLTHLAQPYPPVFTVTYAGLIKEALEMREGALARHIAVPMADPEQKCSPCLSLRQAAWLGATPDLDDDVAAEAETVPMGLGAPCGLQPLEHVQWAESVGHPSMQAPLNASKELNEAIKFESDLEPEEIDDMRREILHRYIKLSKQMTVNKQHWADKSPEEIRGLVSQINGPLFRHGLREAVGNNSFDAFIDDLQRGCRLVGPLPPCEGSCCPGLPKSTPWEPLDEDDLREQRSELNHKVISKLRDMPFSEDILPAVLKDVEAGFMMPPVSLDEVDLRKCNLTRRIPVREERQAGWRTRIVDHETESCINEATIPADKVQHDGLDLFTFIITQFMLNDIQVHLWKRDISSAFRRVPIFAGHLDLSWVVWISEGVRMAAQHVGMPFGTVSAVYAWHRVGHALLMLVLLLCKAPLGRYVDDYFGASRVGVQLSGGACLSVFAMLLGFPTDEAKSADTMATLVVLGASVDIDWGRKLVTMAVEQAKAEKWRSTLESILERGKCSPETAAKMAGRLNFTVSIAANRVGRAFIKPFYAQQHAPLQAEAISCLLAWACHWFVHYLTHRPKAVRRGMQPRPLLVTWHDAAGASRWVAAVVRWNGQYLWTRIKTPQHVWAQLAPRDDSQIGFQELLGIVLIIGTFPELIAGALWVGFGDNDGITHSLAKGGGHNPECNMVIGKIWMHLASCDSDLHAARVETKANIADGPSRDDFSLLQRLNAKYVNPALPDWIHDIWFAQQ